MLDYINIILIILFSLLLLSCIIANGSICYAIITRIAVDGVFKYYIFSMAITDILIGIISVPLYVTFGIFQIPATRQQVKVFNSIDMCLGTCSMFHISLMALDRMMAVSNPFFHRLHMRTRKAALTLVILPWLLASVLTAVNFTVVHKDIRNITSSVIGVGAPFLFTITCYVVVFITIRKRNKRFPQNNCSSHIINEVRLLKMVFCILAVYLMCWLPFAIVNGMILQLISSLGYSRVLSIGYATKFLQYFNSTCNPFVYAIFHPCYRASIKELLSLCFCRKDSRFH